MFDIGWSEMAVVALIALIVIGPKDLPRVMRTASHWARKARGLAREFQSGIDDMIREADLEDAKKALDDAKRLDIDKALGDTLDPTGEVMDEARSIEDTARDTVSDQAGKPGRSGDKPTGETVPAEQGSEEAPGATIVKQPLRVAPPHSLEPPPPDDKPAATASGKKASSKRASPKKASRKKASEKTA
jgi:sec-independent protein translocase protein TatB